MVYIWLQVVGSPVCPNEADSDGTRLDGGVKDSDEPVAVLTPPHFGVPTLTLIKQHTRVCQTTQYVPWTVMILW